MSSERRASGLRARASACWLSVAFLGTLAGCSRSCETSSASGAAPSPASAAAEPRLQSAREALGADAEPSDGASTAAEERSWSYPVSEAGPMQVVVSIPAHPGGQRFPVLVALHGRGEAFKGPARGARGWIDDYGLDRAISRLSHPPLTADDLQGLYGAKRLGALNARLAEQPYRGLIVVCPYTPDILSGDRLFELAEPLARFVVDRLLPRVYRETPAIGSAKTTGIDGVSLGGRAALLVGLSRPRAFGVVATLQPAFDIADADDLAARASIAQKQNPNLILRLLTSEGDYFLRATESISRAFRAHAIAHEFALVPGPHDYVFNRGPGAYEMLLFHDRALRSERPADAAQ